EQFEGTSTRSRPALQHVRIDHRRADVRMPEQLLHGPDVRAILEQVSREGMTQRVTRRSLANSGPQDRLLHGPLHRGLVKVMAALLACYRIDITTRRRKHPLPLPRLGRRRGLPPEGS